MNFSTFEEQLKDEARDAEIEIIENDGSVTALLNLDSGSVSQEFPVDGKTFYTAECYAGLSDEPSQSEIDALASSCLAAAGMHLKRSEIQSLMLEMDED